MISFIRRFTYPPVLCIAALWITISLLPALFLSWLVWSLKGYNDAFDTAAGTVVFGPFDWVMAHWVP